MRFPSLRVSLRALFAGASLSVLAGAGGGCSGGDTPNPVTQATASSASSTSSGAGGHGAGGQGGQGGKGGAGGGAHLVCVSSQTPLPFAGTSDCPAPLPAAPDAFDAALAAGGIDRCHVRLLPQDVALSGWAPEQLADRHQLPDFAALQLGPLRLPGYARETRDWLDEAVTSPNPVSATLAALSARRGHVIASACLDLGPYEPDPADKTPLATAVLLLDKNQGLTGDAAALAAAAMAVPIGVQRKLARVLGAVDHAATEVRAARGTTSLPDLDYLAASPGLYVPGFGFAPNAASLALIDKVDIDRMADAAVILAKVVEDADFFAEPDATFAPFEAQTPLGPVVVHDSSKDTYAKNGPAANAALLFDLGGDDVYEVGAGASSPRHPVGVAIDVRGADTYGYKEEPDPLDEGLLPSDGAGRYLSSATPTTDYGPFTYSQVPRQGSGLTGIGMLFDLGTEGDSYRSLAVSQGFAACGVGALYDAGGDDTYEAEVAVQGSATFGLAALVDRSGNDTYKAFTVSQGFGGAEGAAVLLDGAGDDTYYVDPGDPMLGGHPVYFTPQLPGTGNSSMSQGAAQGRRPATATDITYMAGGLGILRDVKGNDRYTGSVFAQGIGYWEGIGLFLEGGGDDVYDALWYIQGSTAHFALSVFLEQGGNDTYNLEFAPKATSIGVGHDFSASLHIDEGGDDRYAAPGLSLGSGNINGIGCLVNIGGNDSYEAAGDPTFGAGNYSSEAPFGETRQTAPTIGIFVDVGGTDTFTVGGMSRPLAGTTWSYDPQPYPTPQMVTTEHGCGTDQPNGTVTLP